MTDFRDNLYTTSRQHVNGKLVYYAARLMTRAKFGGYRRAQMVWQCEHHHQTRDDAIDCAESALRCDDGSLMSENLIEAMNRKTLK